MAFCKVEICGVNTAKLKTLREKEKMELLIQARQRRSPAARSEEHTV